jgi:hypothetical protein
MQQVFEELVKIAFLSFQRKNLIFKAIFFCMTDATMFARRKKSSSCEVALLTPCALSAKNLLPIDERLICKCIYGPHEIYELASQLKSSFIANALIILI